MLSHRFMNLQTIMNKPLLSICIPTFNRAEYLKENLNSIFSQLTDSAMIEKVEIVVSDNCSQDDTINVVNLFVDKYSNLVYSRNETNLGFDRNVDKLLSIFCGNFAWTISDDEILCPGSIGRIIDIIEKNNEMAVICISSGSTFNGLSEQILRFKDGNEWLNKLKTLDGGGLISSNIFNKKYLPVNRVKYFGNWWVHYSVVLEMIAQRPAILILNDGYFRNTESKHKRTWSWRDNGNGINVSISLKRVIKDLVNFGYDAKIIAVIDRELAIQLPKVLISAKLFNLKMTEKIFRDLIKELKKYPLSLLEALVVSIVPNIIFRYLKSVYDHFKK